MNKYRWKLLPAVQESSIQKYSRLQTQLLVNRGIATPEAQEAFISVDERLLENPFLLPDMSRAIQRLSLALKNKEKIAIYGDFDADGICGTSLLAEGLQSLGMAVIPYLPHRIEDGYGLNSGALHYLKQAGASLVITVDCGITSFNEVKEAQKIGMELIITDHHRPLKKCQESGVRSQESGLSSIDSQFSTHDSLLTTLDSLPPALSVIDPWRSDSLYPFPHLSGTGVAYKLLQAIYHALGKEGPDKRILEMVALGTVADMQPLTGENRYFVKKGLEELNQTARPGLQELTKVSGLTKGRIDSNDLSWVLGPRLNAAGRIDHALLSYNLLFSQTYEEASEKAQQLEELNAQRLKLTQENYELAIQQVIPDSPLIIVKGKFPQGIIGIIAGKLSHEFYRPAIIISEGDEWCRGSARSIPEFDIVEALSALRNFLERYGGHPRAAGFTLSPEKVEAFQEGIVRLAGEKLSRLDLCPSLTIDAILPISLISGSTYGELEKLEPFGQDNPRPIFLCKGTQLIEEERTGKAGEHLKLKLKEGDKILAAIGFNLGKGLPRLEGPSNFDIVYSLGRDNWRGVEIVRLEILDFKQS